MGQSVCGPFRLPSGLLLLRGRCGLGVVLFLLIVRAAIGRSKCLLIPSGSWRPRFWTRPALRKTIITARCPALCMFRSKTALRNRNDSLPDTSLEKVFTEFYRLKNGLEGHPNDETYTDHATIMLVSVVENMCRVKMLQMVGEMHTSKDGSKPDTLDVSVSFLMDTVRKNDWGWAADRDPESAVIGFLKSVKAEERHDGYARLKLVDVDRFVEEVCRKPYPFLKNTILASSYPFQSTRHMMDKFGDVFRGTGYSESDYDGIFMARHALVHSLARDPDARVSAMRRVNMVEKLFKNMLKGHPGTFDRYKGAALADIDPESALRHLKSAMHRLDSDPWARYHLGHVYRKLGNTEDAKRELLEAVEMIGSLRKDMEGRAAHTDYAVADWFRHDMGILAISLGDEMHLLGENGAASTCFEAAVSISDESDPDICVYAAWYQWGVGRFDEAARRLDAALAFKDMDDAKRSKLHCDKGEMLSYLDGRDAEAKECFVLALKLDPDNAEARRRISGLGC